MEGSVEGGEDGGSGGDEEPVGQPEEEAEQEQDQHGAEGAKGLGESQRKGKERRKRTRRRCCWWRRRGSSQRAASRPTRKGPARARGFRNKRSAKGPKVEELEGREREVGAVLGGGRGNSIRWGIRVGGEPRCRDTASGKSTERAKDRQRTRSRGRGWRAKSQRASRDSTRNWDWRASREPASRH